MAREVRGLSLVLSWSALALALVGCDGPSPAPAPPPPKPPPVKETAPAPGPPVPFDPGLATATVLFRTRAKGTLPRMRAVKFDSDPKCGGLHREEVLEETIAAKDGLLANVVVHATAGAERWTYRPATEPVVLDQAGCRFLPHVFTLRVGQPLVIRNSDPTVHNTHAIPKGSLEFNRTQQPGGGDVTEKFTAPEIGVRVRCDVHLWMGAYAGIFAHPFHGVTGADGTLALRVPPGTWEFAAWHEYGKWSAKPEPRRVTVAAGETKEVEFVFEANSPPPLPAYDPASATASIVVRATTKGTLPRMRPIKFDAEPKCAEENPVEVLDETIVATDGRLANAIAWVSRGAERWSYPPESAEARIEMKRCIFVPHVLTLRAGQPLRVNNPDHHMLHLHAGSERNGETGKDVPRGESFVLMFSEEEVGIRMKCDVHGWMRAWAGVFPHPFHGVTDRAGTTTLRVPPGEYEVSAWHEYAQFSKPSPRTVTVAAGETKEVEFVFEVP